MYLSVLPIIEIKSKRVRTAHKHRILGRIRDHHRKERRAAKRNPGQHNSKLHSIN